ncbi:dihydrolipoamide acetyltransferase family protein [Blattabacterium cuenoti]|uniref:dihydrolipoamide acetyltransferase family protein n=1 Tax=Blattabacterium cuenoti TaxID=1653831 RepID=UPI00163CB396|nr:dihydrolipoamide acetyltransferase family protein [Blattabacterium cuenoti]
MADIIFMPRLSDTMEEGTLVKWNKKIGDQVFEGDILAEIETDKAIQDFEIDINGVLLYCGIKEGEKARVNDILAIIGQYGENISSLIKKKTINKLKTEPEKKSETELEKESETKPEKKSEQQRKFISPVAKKMIQDKGINIHNMKGTGDSGRIVKKDIELYYENTNNMNQHFIVSNMRKEIATHLTLSKFTAPHYYLFIEIEMENIIQLRKKLNDTLSNNHKISFNDIIVKAVSRILKTHPYINATWKEKEIIYHYNINIGIAVAIHDGLMVPVIHNSDQKSLLQISKEIKDKVERSKLRKLQQQEIKNSTFTISNLGMYGIDSFTSIINIPNSSILSVGTIKEKPIVKNHKIKIGNIMKITLSCDHRVIDGNKGCNFLLDLKKMLEDPITILV